MTVKYVLFLLKEMEEEWYRPPTNYYNRKKIDFKYQSYGHAAILELKKYIMQNKNASPIIAIDEFRYLMGCYASIASNEEINFMFSVYKEVSSDILEVLQGMQTRKE